MPPRLTLLALAALGLAAGLNLPRPRAAPRHWPGLHNVRPVRPGLISGSLPEGEDGWRSLAAMGVRTVVCVDGLPPDAEMAARFGIRPVHVPIGYDGVPRPAALTVARAARDLPGPVYLHCHHGKHRGPAAAVAAAMCLDPRFTRAHAAKLLAEVGTDPKYAGLIGVPATFVRPAKAELDAAPAAFAPRAEVPDLAARMVEIDGIFDRAKASQLRPGDPAALAELFRESARLPSGRVAESGLAPALAAAADQAEGVAGPGGVVAVGRRCTTCHARYRDAPARGLAP